MIPRFNDARDIFFDRRFGLFVHWGLYAIPAWHEQIIWRGNMKRTEYERLQRRFNPLRFNPDAWLDLAEEAGMQYVCFTTKHMDGFCMWDTQCTDYNVMNTPYCRDVLGMLSEACGRRGFPLSLYYSWPDWHHPNYPSAGMHHEPFGPRLGDEPDAGKYYDFVRQQVTELCTRYGRLYQFFWDCNVQECRDASLNQMIRSLQPGILINDRGPDEGDYGTPERHVPEGRQFSKPTEACQSLGRESWGYRQDEDYYSSKHILQSMDRILAMGGNYLLNVGPQADGTIDGENADALRKIGKWYRSVGEAFGSGTYPASWLVEKDEFAVSEAGRLLRDEVLLTKRGNMVYVHLCRDPQSTSILLKPLDTRPERAILLNNGMELETRVDVTPWHWREKPILRIRNIPVDGMAGTVMVIRLEFGPAAAE